MIRNDLSRLISLSFMLLLAAAVRAQMVTSVTSFVGGGNTLGQPSGRLVQGRNGELFGTSLDPNAYSTGAAFDMTTKGTAAILYAFNPATGGNSVGGLTLATDGNYYGAADDGGTYNDGVLYRVSPTGTYTVLHDFTGADGSGPESPPIQASDGNFYGTTSGSQGSPTVYKYTRSGTFTTLYTFNDETYGDLVAAGLVQGSDGNLYGVAVSGGVNDQYGTVFKLTTSGKLLGYYAFPGGSGGANPYGALIQASDGYFYGTTYNGGYPLDFGYGTVFRMDQNLAVTILYSFDPYTEGVHPSAGLIQGTDGNLFGALEFGGTNNLGALFQITTSGAYAQLYDFSASVGQYPGSPLMQDTSGLFYSTSYQGGAYGFGSVYSLNMGLGPFIAFVSATGKVGQTAEILGQNLKGTTSVTFNGVPATSLSVKSGTYMRAVIPTGATTGKVVVTTPKGVLTSNKNFVIHK
jgi:uncharacterized repeat protein (TIGR03803 family)